jgi:hypothetical protein
VEENTGGKEEDEDDDECILIAVAVSFFSCIGDKDDVVVLFVVPSR